MVAILATPLGFLDDKDRKIVQAIRQDHAKPIDR
jgi:hypothetical protein